MVLITSIGSFSTTAVIKSLKDNKYRVVGCDIHPKEWHYISKEFEKVYKVHLAKDSKEYIKDILKICIDNNVKFLVPLTDIEIDIINLNRKRFKEKGIILCVQEAKVLKIVRDKLELHKFFLENTKIDSISTYRIDGAYEVDKYKDFPYVIKPRNGRSSEGFFRIENKEDFLKVDNFEGRIIQKMISGNIICVDYVRNKKLNKDFFIIREELLRTKNGAGITVKIRKIKKLEQTIKEIGEKLDINGCICIEFIENNGKYYLIDINPRFSAGIAFSQKMGYDFVKNHMNCFEGKEISKKIEISEKIITKHYEEKII